MLARLLPHRIRDRVGDEQGFVLRVESRVQRDPLAFLRGGPQRLALARGVVGHDGARRRQDVPGRPVVLLEANDRRVAVIVLEIEDVPNVRPAPTVDRLVLVADHADVVVLLAQQAHQLVLAAVGVLIFVDHQVRNPPVIQLPGSLVVVEQADRFQQQVVEIKRVGVAQRLFVLLVEHRDPRHAGVFGALVHFLRRLFAVLGAADERQHRPVLHELLIDSQTAVRGAQRGKLVVLVVDGESPVETRADLGQRIAVLAQQAHAERVKRGQPEL